MEAVAGLLIAVFGEMILKGLLGLGALAGGGGDPAQPAPCSLHETAEERRSVCPQDVTAFTLLEPGTHWMVRR